MNVGELYKISHKWLLPRTRREFWSNCGPILYVGESAITRGDGVCIVNHLVLASGHCVTLDHTFLRFLEPINESR